MHEYVLRVYDYLNSVGEGKAQTPPALAEEFADLCKKAYTKRFVTQDQQKFSLRPSNIGRPFCQLYAEYHGWPSEPLSPDFIYKMYQGDLVEASAYVTLKAAGVNIQHKSLQVSGTIFGRPVNGELDLVIDRQVWDIKGVSKYSFEYKLSGGDVATWVGNDDPFGYLGQGFAYSILSGFPLGGWIGVSRESAEWAVADLKPSEYDHYKAQAEKVIERNVDGLGHMDRPFVRSFEDQPETFRKKETGNRVLGMTCSFCKYKWKCWPELKMLPSLPSEAKTKTQVYYTKISNEWKSKDAE